MLTPANHARRAIFSSMTVLILSAAAILVSTPVLATNGDELIGVGPGSRAMGGWASPHRTM